MPKRKSLLDQMAVKGAKPDACGFVPFDPKIMAAVMRAMEKNR